MFSTTNRRWLSANSTSKIAVLQMKISITIALLLILISCGTLRTANSKTIFRHIDLGLYGRIEIGDDMASYKTLLEKKEDRFYLKDNVFGGANSIELVIDASHRISEMIFDYGNDVNLESKISEYAYLGNPKLKNHSAIWHDGRTEFSIYERDARVYSRIRALK